MALLKRTTTGKVFKSIYLICLIPTGFVCLVMDGWDIFSHTPRVFAFPNFKFWLNLAIEGGLIAIPFVLVLAMLLAFVNNIFAADKDEVDGDEAV
jgi:hypothetical protein